MIDQAFLSELKTRQKSFLNKIDKRVHIFLSAYEMTRNNERPVSVSYYLLTRRIIIKRVVKTRCFQKFWSFHVVFIVNNHRYC